MMITAALPLIPILAGILVLLIRNRTADRILLIFAAAAHVVLTVLCWLSVPAPILDGWFALDRIGLLFLTVTSLLFFAAAVYGVNNLYHTGHSQIRSIGTESAFITAMLFFLGTMTMVTLCQHFSFIWVTIEATTLASAPLIYFHRSQHSIEATWKYLILCSFGIALALLGNFFLAIAGSATHMDQASMLLNNLVDRARFLQPTWLKAAFLLLFVGYGTKMGLAPFHSWLPDAHSEAPSFVSALLSGALLNCAFLGILRAFQVCLAAGIGPFAQPLLIGFGLLSMAFAGVFILKQTDFKRMLAYSSVEHMGIIALSMGLGGTAFFGGMFHALNHSLTKAMLFLVAGNILGAYRTKSTHVVRGVLDSLPASGTLWFIGFLAIVGMPPFGLFVSEFMILKAAIEQHRLWVAFLYLLFLAVIFIGMAAIALRMLLGKPAETPQKTGYRETLWSLIPPVALAAAVLFLGVHIPPFLERHLHEIAQGLVGSFGPGTLMSGGGLLRDGW